MLRASIVYGWALTAWSYKTQVSIGSGYYADREQCGAYSIVSATKFDYTSKEVLFKFEVSAATPRLVMQQRSGGTSWSNKLLVLIPSATLVILVSTGVT